MRIVAAIANKYSPPLSSGIAEEDQALAMKMLHLSRQANNMRIRVETEGWDKRSFSWKKLDTSDVALDFPKFTEEEIRNLTLGTYQVKMAKAYTHEHLQVKTIYFQT